MAGSLNRYSPDIAGDPVEIYANHCAVLLLEGQMGQGAASAFSYNHLTLTTSTGVSEVTPLTKVPGVRSLSSVILTPLHYDGHAHSKDGHASQYTFLRKSPLLFWG